MCIKHVSRTLSKYQTPALALEKVSH